MFAALEELWRCTRAELLKAKGSFAVWLSLAGTAANVLLFFVLEYFNSEGGQSWRAYVEAHYAGIALMMLPLYVIILASLITFMEHRRNMWVQLRVLPVSRWSLYGSKLLFMALLFIGAHVLFILGMLCSGWLLGVLRPESGMQDFAPDLRQIGQLAAQTLGSILGLMGLHVWLSMRFRHFIIPLTIGILGFVAVSLLGPQWPYLWLIPYGPPTMFMPAAQGITDGATLPLAWIASAAYFGLFTLIGYLEFKKN